MYSFSRKTEGVSRKLRDILIILICILLIINVVQFFNYQTTMTRSVALRNTLVSRVRQDIAAARSVAPQMSRSGGSNTYRWLAQTRQYLYGITQLNELTTALFGDRQMLVPQEEVNIGMTAVDNCITQMQEGLAIDTPLSMLWKQLDILNEKAGLLD